MTEPAARTPYGPNTPAVRRFLQRFAALSPAEWGAAARAFNAAERSAGFRRADASLGVAISAAGREAERDAAMRPLLQLVRVTSAEAAADGEPALDRVAPAAAAAVLALLARDVLRPDAFATLYAPFSELVPLDQL
jgi:hypothetical protein